MKTDYTATTETFTFRTLVVVLGFIFIFGLAAWGSTTLAQNDGSQDGAQENFGANEEALPEEDGDDEDKGKKEKKGDEGEVQGFAAQAAAPNDKVALCHKTGPNWNYLETPSANAGGHFDHGDFLYEGAVDLNDKDAWCAENVPVVEDDEDPTATLVGTASCSLDGVFSIDWELEIGGPGDVNTRTLWMGTTPPNDTLGVPGIDISGAGAPYSGGTGNIFTGSYSEDDSPLLATTNHTTSDVPGSSIKGEGRVIWNEGPDEVSLVVTYDVDVPSPCGQPVACELEVVSDETNLVVESDAYAVATWEHPAWTAEIPATYVSFATWIWNSLNVQDPTNDETYTFSQTFQWTGDSVTSTLLEVAADNSYVVRINGNVVGSDATENNFQSVDSYSAFDGFIQNGENTIEVEVKNWAMGGGTAFTNPAGALYRLFIEGETTEGGSCGYVDPQEPGDDEPTSCLLEDQDAIIIILDTFSRPDDTELGTTEIGGAEWTTVEGDWEIINGEAVRTGGGNNRVMTVVESGVSNAAIEVTLPRVPDAANQAGLGLVFRYTDTSNFWYFHADPTRWYSLEKYEGGVHAQLATAPVVPDDGDVIRVLLNGPFISIYVNGELYASVNDSFNETATQHGIRGTYWATEEDGAHDNFIITAGLGQQCDDESYDWGDAPDASVGGMNFPTTSANNGARHLVVPGIFLGVLIDSDNDGHPHDGAIGDDAFDGLDDEDGVVFTSPLTPNATSTVTVTASVDGYLSAWFDFNLDGDWDELDENIFSSYALTAGENYLSFPVPAHATQDTGISRWRFTTSGSELSYIGLAPDGEVEDHKFSYVDDGPMCEEGPTWAASVVESGTTQGTRKNGSAVLPARSNPASALGEPDGVGNPASGFFSLGVNGVLTVEFDHYVENVDGVDLSFHEITNGNRLSYPEENADVEVSQDGITWYSIGTVSSHDAIAYLDFDSTGLGWIKFVRLTDTTDFGPHANDADGYDIDAIDASNGLCEMPDPQPQTSTVTICKLDEEQNYLPNWTVMLLGDFVETVEVSSNGTEVFSSSLALGEPYALLASGVYNYRNAVGSTTDAAFSMRSYSGDPVDPTGHLYEPWVDVNDLFLPGYLGITLDGDIAGTDWGTIFNSLHEYALGYTGSGASASFKIWDDNYGDNFGSLFVDIYEGYVGVTGENGCVTFNDVPFGTYQLDEIMQDGWEYVGGSADEEGNVEVDEAVEEFYIVNFFDEPKGDDDDDDDDDDSELSYIYGYKWNDADSDGEWGGYEFGIAGWTITISNDDDFVTTTVTDEYGQYGFWVPSNDTYYVCEFMQGGWMQTYPISGEGVIDCQGTNGYEVYVGDPDEYGAYYFGNHEEHLPGDDDDDDDDDDDNGPTPSSSSNNSSSRRRGGGGSSGGGEVLGATTGDVFCPFLKEYLHINKQNNPMEVNKAKAFFNAYLGLNLPLDGTFDRGMFAAAVNFQNMFKPDVLDTWVQRFNIDDNATGYIYQTTKWKINSIMCPGYETFPDLVLATNV